MNAIWAFVRRAGADHGFLDGRGRIFRNADTAARGGCERNATRSAKRQRGACIVVDEGFLNRCFMRTLNVEHGAQFVEQAGRDASEFALRRRTDHAMRDMTKPRALAFNTTPQPQRCRPGSMPMIKMALMLPAPAHQAVNLAATAT